MTNFFCRVEEKQFPIPSFDLIRMLNKCSSIIYHATIPKLSGGTKWIVQTTFFSLKYLRHVTALLPNFLIIQLAMTRLLFKPMRLQLRNHHRTTICYGTRDRTRSMYWVDGFVLRQFFLSTKSQTKDYVLNVLKNIWSAIKLNRAKLFIETNHSSIFFIRRTSIRCCSNKFLSNSWE